MLKESGQTLSLAIVVLVTLSFALYYAVDRLIRYYRGILTDKKYPDLSGVLRSLEETVANLKAEVVRVRDKISSTNISLPLPACAAGAFSSNLRDPLVLSSIAFSLAVSGACDNLCEVECSKVGEVVRSACNLCKLPCQALVVGKGACEDGCKQACRWQNYVGRYAWDQVCEVSNIVCNT